MDQESFARRTFDALFEFYTRDGVMPRELIQTPRSTPQALLRDCVKRHRPGRFARAVTRRRTLLYLGDITSAIGTDDDTALALFLEARAQSEESEPAVWYRASAGICVVLTRNGRFEEANQICDVTIWSREVLAVNAAAAAAILRTAATAHEQLGNVELADERMRDSLAYLSRAFGHDSVEYADALARYAEMLHGAGDVEQARTIAARAVETATRHGAAHVIARAQNLRASGPAAEQRTRLRNEAVKFGNAGQHDRALEILQKVFASAEGSGAGRGEILDTKLLLGQTLMQVRRMAEAMDLFTEVTNVAAEHQDRVRAGRALLNAGVIYVRIGADTEALEALTRAREWLERGQGHSDDVASALYEIAIIESRRGEHERGLTTMDRAISMFGPKHLSLGPALQEKTWMLARLERWDEAFEMMTSACDLIEADVVQAILMATQAQREQLVKALFDSLDLLLSLAVYLRTPAVVAGAFDRLLWWKGVALEWTALEARGLTTREAAAELEPMRPNVKGTAVAAALPADAVLVEFARYESIDFTKPGRSTSGERVGNHRYVAFALRHNREPLLIDVGDADDVEEQVARFRSWITERRDESAIPRPMTLVPASKRASKPPLVALDDWLAAGATLRDALFGSALDGLPSDAMLRIAPDGDIARLPFAALPFGDGYFVDAFDIAFVNSGREVLSERHVRTPPSGPPVVVADPDFDLNIASASTQMKPFAPLDGTRVEGNEVAARLGVQPLSGANAIASTVHSVRGPRILHLATHGFFLTDDRPPMKEIWDRVETITIPGGGKYLAASTPPSRSPDEGPPVDRFTRLGRLANPLLRAGVALAGANTWVSGGTLPAEASNGLLSAEEICAMNLRGTQMAVLSACESGLGEIHKGEGVYGLRRAFAIAGAETLVMSLWKIPDNETAHLMTRFYDALADGRPRARALRIAQLASRAENDDPLCWSAFAIIGNPSPL